MLTLISIFIFKFSEVNSLGIVGVIVYLLLLLKFDLKENEFCERDVCPKNNLCFKY